MPVPERGRLREARRRATDITIEEAAVTLALEHGLESDFFMGVDDLRRVLHPRGGAGPA